MPHCIQISFCKMTIHHQVFLFYKMTNSSYNLLYILTIHLKVLDSPHKRLGYSTQKTRIVHTIDPPAIRSSTAAISLIWNRSLSIKASSMNCEEKVCLLWSPITGRPSFVAFCTADLYIAFWGWNKSMYVV